MRCFRNSSRGFTLLELLVVISIIGLLSSIILSAVNDARTRAQGIAILSDFREIEKGLYLLADDEKVTEWWCDDEMFCAKNFGLDNIPISQLIASKGLGPYLPKAPVPAIGSGYYYDNDDVPFSCGGAPSEGVNIVAASASVFAPQLDATLDHGDGPQCGHITWDASNIYYKLGDSSSGF